MRRRLALLAVLAIALVLPAPASAARSTHQADHQVTLSCDGIHPTSGTGFAFFDVSFSEINQLGTTSTPGRPISPATVRPTCRVTTISRRR